MSATSHPPGAVAIDVFNTLLRPRLGTAGTFARALRSYGIRADAQVMARLQLAADGLEHRKWSQTRTSYLAWTRCSVTRLAQHGLDQSTADLAAVVPALEQLHQAPMRPFPDVAPFLISLRRHGIRVVACSNWSWDLADDLRRGELAHLIDEVVTSARAGIRKPHPEIYQTAVAAAGVDAADVTFVGDNLRTDVHGPRAAGLRAIHLRRDGQPSAGVPTAHRLDTLTDAWFRTT